MLKLYVGESVAAALFITAKAFEVPPTETLGMGMGGACAAVVEAMAGATAAGATAGAAAAGAAAAGAATAGVAVTGTAAVGAAAVEVAAVEAAAVDAPAEFLHFSSETASEVVQSLRSQGSSR